MLAAIHSSRMEGSSAQRRHEAKCGWMSSAEIVCLAGIPSRHTFKDFCGAASAIGDAYGITSALRDSVSAQEFYDPIQEQTWIQWFC
jgi:hypothetical protein